MGPAPARRRILVVEDEVLIGMLLEDMLGDLGYEVAGTAARFEDALALAQEVKADGAILDINLNGSEVYPIADVLARRGIPFVFASGYGESSVPGPYQRYPTMQKPFRQETLENELARLFTGGRDTA
jgi:CheY-like chemotaxis protein